MSLSAAPTPRTVAFRRCSPSLHAVARGIPASDLHRFEEDAVMALQRFAKAAASIW
jgi:hypothetical protein